MLDVRKPVAVLFLVMGGLLALFGIMSPGTSAEVTAGFNVNLVWGVALMLFAAVLFLISFVSREKS